jgi:hypothetical protein
VIYFFLVRKLTKPSMIALLAAVAFAPAALAQATPPGAQVYSLNSVGKPDISGIWILRGSGAPGEPMQKKTSAPAPESELWRTTYARPHLSDTLPPFQPSAAAKYKATTPEQDPELTCVPPGIPATLLEPFPIEILQVPGKVLMLFEYDHLVRPIYTDGRKIPDDPDPTYMGSAVGSWDGDTLVVDTVGFNEKTWLDTTGLPHSDALHVTERIRRLNHNTLEDIITIDDPKSYTKPWTVRKVFDLKPKWEIMEYECEENNKENPSPIK